MTDPSTAAEARVTTVDDLYSFHVPADPQISPDGRRVVYTVQRVERETEKKYTNLWLVDAEGGVYMRPRDVAKLWQLFLNGGKWNGAQIVSPEWVKDSVSPHMDLGPNAKYGLKWWLYPYGKDNKFTAWSGNGFGGQFPIVLPEYDIVFVVTAWNVTGPTLRPRDSIPRIVGMVVDGPK